MKKPKYKIGDIVIYKNRYQEPDDDPVYAFQSNIVESYCLLMPDEHKDEAEWFYQTEETLRNTSDSLQDSDILGVL